MFWSLTPREIKAHMDGAMNRLKAEHQGRAWLAWHTAALGRVKKMPKLEKLISEPKKSLGRKSWQDQLAIAMAWNAEVNKRKK